MAVPWKKVIGGIYTLILDEIYNPPYFYRIYYIERIKLFINARESLPRSFGFSLGHKIIDDLRFVSENS